MTGLAALTRLALLSAGLALLSRLAVVRLLLTCAEPGCPCPGWELEAAAEPVELVAQTGQIVHGPIERGVLGSVLSGAHGASRVADLLTQFLQVAGEAGFGGIGELAAPQPIRAALHAGAEIVFVHAIERATQLAGSRRLRGRELARRGAHLLGEARQVVGHLLAIVDHLVDFLGGRVALAD